MGAQKDHRPALFSVSACRTLARVLREVRPLYTADPRPLWSLPLRCPFCQQDDDRVIDSRATDDGTAIRRRRECNLCKKRFTTYERVEGEEVLRVIKKDGKIQTFDRRKILHGMLVACEKRPVPSDDLEAAVNRIYHHLLSDGAREVQSTAIGALVMEELRKLDQVAYVRFASVYREFKDLNEFMHELRKVIADRPDRPDSPPATNNPA